MNVIEAICKDDLRFIDDHPAIITPGEIISYRQLINKVSNVSAYLNLLGVKQNTKTAILSSNSPEYIINLLALWNLNACAVPLNTMLTDDELSGLINFSDAEYLLYGKDQKRNINNRIKISSLDIPAGEEQTFIANTTDIEGLSLIMFTSGATGKPKGVMHILNDLINSADNGQNLLRQTESDKWLASLPFYHIGGLSIIIRALRYGSVIIIPESMNNTDIKSAFNTLSPTLASLVATQLRRLLNSGWKPGKELRALLLGGGFADGDLIKEAAAAGCPIVNVYGSTETSAFVSALNTESVVQKPLSSGKALGKNKVFIVDEKLNELPAGTTGEILIESNSLFHGYYRDEESYNAKMRNGRFLTGDTGYVDKECDLFVQARRTDLIVTGGENVNPLEVEMWLNKMEGIYDSCVFPMTDKEWGQTVAAAIVSENEISIGEIAQFLKGKIAGYKIPKKLFRVEKIPRSPLGKIMREKMKEEIDVLHLPPRQQS